MFASYLLVKLSLLRPGVEFEVQGERGILGVILGLVLIFVFTWSRCEKNAARVARPNAASGASVMEHDVVAERVRLLDDCSHLRRSFPDVVDD